ncbi:MAG: radical SAM protein, partial [Spirochaetaceae bacterium]|nr:radical SAM protein [Spirochaetaceae bacterium]
PDYAGLDFGRYLRVVDSANPMHRLWSDSPWLKYHLAHGCYWKNCAFCDVELDYVANYAPADVEALVRAADAVSARTGLYGLHFVDEAMPMARLLAFARANRGRAARGLKAFHFWGNARFDASWTEARCEFLAASGLVAVSGGIEIATERGLEMTDKGFDLEGLVRSLVALKRSGILVHAYLIYGFPGQDAAGIVDSAETLRQLIASGLVDSAFWHRFVLTRHSRLMAEKRSGGRPELAPRGAEAEAAADGSPLFADNDLSFSGESSFDRFAGLLEAALADWMEGEDLERPAAKRLGMRGGGLRADLVEGLIARAEDGLDAARAAAPSGDAAAALRAHWLAGEPVLAAPGLLRWAYRGELEELGLPAEGARRLRDALVALGRSGEGAPLAGFLAEAGLGPGSPELAALRGTGLALV